MTWVKGQSGNPGGRIKTGLSFADTLRKHLTPELMEELIARMFKLAKRKDTKLSEYVRMMEAIRDTLDGRPLQRLEHAGEEGGPIPLLVTGPKT